MLKSIFVTLFVLFAACGDNIPLECPAPEPGPITVYPCNTQHGACAAARDVAMARCDHAAEIALCDDECPTLAPAPGYYECVAAEMASLCTDYYAATGATCNGPYDGWRELNACLAMQGTACDDSFPTCEL